MLENGRLDGCLNEIELEFVEREATPRFLMKLRALFRRFRYHLAVSYV